jgi:hypothetical protein
VVTEVAPQLADHGGDREGREGRSVLGIEAFDRLEHPEHRHLLEIVERFVAVGEAAGERARELEIVLDERVAQSRSRVRRYSRNHSMVASSSTRSTGSILTASVPGPLDETEAAWCRRQSSSSCSSGDHVVDRARELSELGRSSRSPRSCTIDLDQCRRRRETEASRRAPERSSADQRRTRARDRDAQIFDVADRQSGARVSSVRGRGERGEPEDNGVARESSR